MAVEIRLPVLGEGVDSGTVAGVLVAAGDTVEADAPLIELETDKAVIEVPASEAGVVTSLAVKAGDTVAVGQVIATIEPGAAPAEQPAAEQPRRQAPPPPVPEPPAAGRRRHPPRPRPRRPRPASSICRSGRSRPPPTRADSRASWASTSPRCRAPETAGASCPVMWYAPRAPCWKRHAPAQAPPPRRRCPTSAAGGRWSANR